MAGLFDTEYHERKIREYQAPLSKLSKVINWELFREPIENALYVEPKGAGGRPSFDKIMMFKILVLQKYYNLSDEQTEFQINDRTSFKQFLGLKIEDTVPDEKTVWHFKEQLANKELSEKLFNLFAEQLITQGIVAKEGSMIDASFVDVPRQRNSKEDNADIKKDAIPIEFSKKDKNGKMSKLSQKDTDARWMTKSGERHYGYKDHVNADSKTKLITKYSVTSAAPHDSTEIKNIIDETDNRLHADSAYRSAEIEEFLETQNCESFVHEKGYRNNPLTEKQKESNNFKSKIRARVEHIFGFMTNSMNDALHMKCIGIKRVKDSIGLLNLTYNLFRYEQLVRLQKVRVM
jgi:IS5 family transposase